MSFDVWDVVKVPFPYTNRPVQQYRPALVVARHQEAGSPALLWVLMITSAGNRGWQGDVAMSDSVTTGLRAASIVRTAKVATIEAASARAVGKLAEGDRSLVRRCLSATLGTVLATEPR